MIKINRVGKVYTAFYDGKTLTFKEQHDTEKKCSQFIEDIDIHVASDKEGNTIHPSETEFEYLKAEARY